MERPDQTAILCNDSPFWLPGVRGPLVIMEKTRKAVCLNVTHHIDGGLGLGLSFLDAENNHIRLKFFFVNLSLPSLKQTFFSVISVLNFYSTREA